MTTPKQEARRHSAREARDARAIGGPHIASVECWCRPTPDPVEPRVFIHHPAPADADADAAADTGDVPSSELAPAPQS